MGLLDEMSVGLVPQNIGIQEFAESSEFCNKPLFPRQIVLLKLIFLEEMTGYEEDVLSQWIDENYSEVRISPNIRERRDYLRERGYKHFREIQLVGGRRSSKGFTTGICLAKSMWDTVQIGTPQEHYGIDKGRVILFSCVAAAESQAKEFQYTDFVSTVENCKAFEPYFQKSLETEFRVATSADLRKISSAKSKGDKVQRDISSLRGKALAANAGTLRGSATMAIALDEMAHMTIGESKASAGEVYQAAIPSINQFGLDGMIFANSSPYTKVGKFYEIFEVAMRPFRQDVGFVVGAVPEDQTDPRGFSIEFPSWELYKDYRKYKSKWQPRERGRELGKMPTVSPDWSPDEVDAEGDPLYSTEDQGLIQGQRLEEAKNPEAFKVEQRGQFAEVIDAFLNPSMVDQMYAGIPIGTEMQPDGSMRRRFTPLSTNFGQGALNTYRYKFHLDPSSTTAGFGFAIAHVEHITDPITGDGEEHCVFDLIKKWDPKDFPGRVIRWKPILEEVMMLADIFRPFEITMDQHQCLSADTLVATQWGLVSIGRIGKDLEVGKGRSIELPVMSFHDDRPIATYIHRRGPSTTYKLTVRGGYQIEATPDHRLWVQKDRIKPWNAWPQPQWERVENLRIGDRLLIKPGTICNASSSVMSAHFERHANCTIERLPAECNQDLAAYLGWMVSEGCTPREPTTHMGSFTNAEPEAWTDFVALSERLFGHTPRRSAKSNAVTGVITYQANVPRSINRFLNNLGASGPSHEKRVPSVLFGVNPDVVRAFLRTAFDGDGSVGIKPSRPNDLMIVYTTESPGLAKDIQQLLLSVGIVSTLYQDPHNPALREHPCHRVKLFGENLVRFVDEIGFVSKRKGDQAYAARERAVKLTNVRDNRSREADGSLWVRITSIEESEADCYDLSVPGQESFVANGIVSHNSMEPIQTLQEMLNKRNIVCQVYTKTATNESNWKGWQVLKTAIYQGLVHAPMDEGQWNDPTSQNELKFLQELPTGGKFPKVEKQDIGPVRTKDQADCIRECTYTLIGNLMANRMRDRLSTGGSFGAPGGFGIGRGPVGGNGPPGISEYYSSREQKIASGRLDRGTMALDRANLTRSALGGRGKYQGSRSRGR